MKKKPLRPLVEILLASVLAYVCAEVQLRWLSQLFSHEWFTLYLLNACVIFLIWTWRKQA